MSIISHELWTPLTSIRGFLEILRNRLDAMDQTRRENVFESIGRNVHRLERLIKDIIDLGMTERAEFQLKTQVLDVSQILEKAVRTYKTSLGSFLEFFVLQNSLSFLVELDTVRFLQVLDNLIENAIKHTSAKNRKISVNLDALSNVVRIDVSDNGAGIACEDLLRIFELFVSIPTRYSHRGTGIGLYVSKMIVEAHGGTLVAHSDGSGKGATFSIELPRIQ